MPEIDVNAMIWEYSCPQQRKQRYILDDYRENLRTTKNTDFEKIKQLFDISQKIHPGSKSRKLGNIHN